VTPPAARGAGKEEENTERQERTGTAMRIKVIEGGCG